MDFQTKKYLPAGGGRCGGQNNLDTFNEYSFIIIFLKTKR